MPFPQTKKVSISRKLYELHSKPHFYAQKLLLHVPFFVVLKNFSFSQTKIFLFTQTLPYCPPKQPFSALHFPFAPSHNLLSAKNTAVLLQSALNPHAVTPEPRTDSKPFRRQFARKAGFGSCCRKLFQNYFRQSFESRSQDGVPCAFYVTFCTMQKVTIRTPLPGVSRFYEPRISSPQWRLR